MKTLKLIWGHRPDGAWNIMEMKSLDLKGDGEEEFFAIRDDLVVTHSPPIAGTIKSVMGESIVPVVASVHGESTLRCVGTGFFISCTGLLITAAHVITDPIDRSYGKTIELDDLTLQARELSFGVLVPNNPLFQTPGYVFFPFEWSLFLAERRPNPLPIAGIDLKLTSDIAICKVPARPGGLAHQPLTIVQSGLTGSGISVGSTAYALGYAGMTEVEINKDQHGQIIGAGNFHLHASIGDIIGHFLIIFKQKQSQRRDLAFPSLSHSGRHERWTDFDREGVYVHGVISKGWEDAAGVAKYSFGSMLRPSMSLPISRMNGASLDEILKSGHRGHGNIARPRVCEPS